MRQRIVVGRLKKSSDHTAQCHRSKFWVKASPGGRAFWRVLEVNFGDNDTGIGVSHANIGVSYVGIGVSHASIGISHASIGVSHIGIGVSHAGIANSCVYLLNNHFTPRIMANPVTKGRVALPKTPKEGFELAAKIYAKHLADGAASELKNLVDVSWDATGPGLAAGLAHHTEAERLKGLMEAAYRLRDAAFAPVADLNRASAAYLKGKYAKNPKKLAEWGYTVDDSPRKPAVPKPAK